MSNSRLIENYEEKTSATATTATTTVTSQEVKPIKNIVRSKSSPIKEKYSPSLTRKSHNNNSNNKIIRKNECYNEQLSSPSLVGQNIYEKQSEKIIDESRQPIIKQRERMRSPKSEVLRVPKKSEMAYFGVQVSPKPERKQSNKSKLIEQPDLIQFNSNNKSKRITAVTKQNKSTKSTEPMYENVEVLKKEMINNRKNEFDSSILEELTKAADQIMQAVNGYVDDERLAKSGTDDDKYDLKRSKEPLDTISETKSWKRECSHNKKLTSHQTDLNRSKLKSTSSNSSLESFTRECKKSSSTPIKKPDRSSIDRQQRKKLNTNNDTTQNTKALTRARRLQRASSREALLQSHGSSSEDLPTSHNDMPLRKSRLVRRTKTTQLTMSNGLEMHKKPEKSLSSNKRSEELQARKDDR